MGSVLILLATLTMLNLTAFAAESNLDYYAPRDVVQNNFYANVINYHLQPGRDDMQTGHYDRSMHNFEFILNYYTNHPEALIGLSELCARWKSPVCDSVAERRFQRAIERNPRAALSYVVQGLHLHRKNKLEEAVKSYKQAIELSPDSVNAHYNLGLAYTDSKQYELANLHAQKSYALGVRLTGLRTRLEKVGKWNPNVTLPANEVKSAAPESSPPTLPENEKKAE